jgi:hypothetical protein
MNALLAAHRQNLHRIWLDGYPDTATMLANEIGQHLVDHPLTFPVNDTQRVVLGASFGLWFRRHGESYRMRRPGVVTEVLLSEDFYDDEWADDDDTVTDHQGRVILESDAEEVVVSDDQIRLSECTMEWYHEDDRGETVECTSWRGAYGGHGVERGVRIHQDLVVWSYALGCYIREYQAVPVYDGDDKLDEYHPDVVCVRGTRRYILTSDVPEGVVWAFDIDEWCEEDACHWDDGDERYVYHEYNLTSSDDDDDDDDSDPGRVVSYQSNRAASVYHGSSGWTVGFEVERNRVGDADSQGDYVGEYPLFAGWCTDGSCGIEGITHAYDPCDPQVVAAFISDVQASTEPLDEGKSGKDCGGHMTIACPSRFSPEDLRDTLCDYAGLWYALYRGRLSNQFCSHDLLMNGDTSTHHRYYACRLRSYGVEWRFPSAIPSADTIVHRFQLAGLMCQSVTRGHAARTFFRRAVPVVMDMYGGDRAKVAKIMRYARHFQTWLDSGGKVLHPSVKRFIPNRYRPVPEVDDTDVVIE